MFKAILDHFVQNCCLLIYFNSSTALAQQKSWCRGLWQTGVIQVEPSSTFTTVQWNVIQQKKKKNCIGYSNMSMHFFFVEHFVPSFKASMQCLAAFKPLDLWVQDSKSTSSAASLPHKQSPLWFLFFFFFTFCYFWSTWQLISELIIIYQSMLMSKLTSEHPDEMRC